MMWVQPSVNVTPDKTHDLAKDLFIFGPLHF